MRSSGLRRVRQAIKHLAQGESRLLFGYLVKVWELTVPGYYPTAAISGYKPGRPLAGYLKRLLPAEQQQVMRELCDRLDKQYPAGIPAQPEIRSLAAR
ncbi:MAG: hypothetical protein Q8L21_03365 [Candidatus Komeilibacteria bacterium]|nr:hypothetical protein [Candidatus Komeilibacteria bacterium]